MNDLSSKISKCNEIKSKFPSHYMKKKPSGGRYAEALYKVIDNLYMIFINHKKKLIDNQIHNGFSRERNDTTKITNANSVFKVVNCIP